MPRRLDKLLIIDLEATCWEGDPPEGQASEIIEIGLCVLDVATGEREEPQGLLIKPQRSTLSDFCIQLTTITPEMLAGGMDFVDACTLLQETYDSRWRTWVSFGDYDRMMFQKQCADRGIPYPFGSSHINAKNLFALQQGLKREVGLTRAMKILDLPFEGTLHRGVDDAWNIATVLNRVLFGRSG
jgi:inhibitor of KinA sporulation pathway (predicted exonuclease)